MINQDQQMKANIQAFIRQAKALSDNKIYFNKPVVKKFNIMEQYFDLSRQLLGKDFLFLQDATGVRLYLRDVFGPQSLRYFEDSEGEMVLDIEHALLFYYKLVAMNSPLLKTALGVVYFVAGHQLDDEFGQLMAVTTKNQIKPLFKLEPKLFRWERCNHVLRKYMLQLSQPEGYTAYYFEKPAITQIAYLTTQGVSFDNASATIRNMQGGIFYSFLPQHIENMLMPSILSGGFDTTLMDGQATQTFIRDTAKIATEYTVDDVYNVYNQMVKPVMVELMGMIISNISTEISNNQYLAKSDVSIYHLSPQRLGILIKNGVSINEVLPTLHSYFKPVESLDLSQVINGEFL